MTTEIIARSAPRFQENSPRQLRTQASSSDDPISYQNLTVVSKLSKGKFPIYLVNSNISGQSYAMKVFSNIVKDSQENYNNELRFASLNHPNVLSIVSANKDKIIVQKGLSIKVTYVLSEYAPHGDLFDFIINHKDQVDEKLARTYFRQLIDGLEYLHAIGISHLDIKPENLLIGADFNLKIADFDLSHFAGDSKIMSRGTRMYRAPEFYNFDSAADIHLDSPAAADIYSAGIILFILKCVGVYPHPENLVIDGINFTELMEKDSSKFWTLHTELQGKPKDFFDRRFKNLFRKMVKRNPKNRISIKKIKQSKWYNGPVYTPYELQAKMKSILNC